ncbi:MAG: hypothetical protein DMD41_02870 [Gemmatimonadetes bacterium]|uniref:Uncharacterized protein n=1 Tax=Candidatus Segetimicrobium genomatis TaxID=2569760 RepID=A0A537KMS5_9BACT|nr:MAG: hypothetical protein DMD41_02870 [Gemmatimonadota bacterium]TMI97068.1 MAG: hypothetical protein E6H01_13430 [Terrabacteria group bacterium ANGP1]
MDGPDFQRLAEIEVDQVKPEHQGFTLTGQGPDQAEYRLDLHFELPLDARTRTVLGELLSHAELTISRRAPAAPLTALRARRDRAHRS